MIISRTPFRISFFGGGTDFPQWFKEHDGSVLSCSIDKYAYISLRKLPPFFSHKHRVVYSDIELCESTKEIKHPSVRQCLDFLKVTDGLEIHYDGDLPSRSGLGSSSSFTVGLLLALKAYQGQTISQKQLADLAITIERDLLAEAGGLQDQIAVAHGGLNHIKFSSAGYTVNPVVISPKNRKELSESLVLFFTGKSRLAELIEGSKIEAIQENIRLYRDIHGLVESGLSVLRAPTFSAAEFGKILNENWVLKKGLAKEVTNSALEDVYAQGIEAGAYGGKILGAGGGGFFLFCVDSYRREEFIREMGHLLHIPFRFEYGGSQLALYQP